MKKKVLLSMLLLCLAAFSPVLADRLDRLAEAGWETVTPGVMRRPLENGKIETIGFGAEGSRQSLAGPSDPIPEDLLLQMERAGWEQIQPGVMQLGLEGDKVEIFGFGTQGVLFKLEAMKEYLAFLRKEYARHPSRELRRAIRSHRVEILRTQAALNKAEATGMLESTNEAITAWGHDCQANYDASVYTFPLAQGVSANAKAYFNNDCGYTGEVYVTTYASATAADGTVFIVARNDPTTAPNTPRFGSNVTANASVSVNGVMDCYSSASASVTNYDLGITYLVSSTNRKCSGSPGAQAFAADAPANIRLSGATPLYPWGSGMIANLNSTNWHDAQYLSGLPIYNGSAGTPRTIVCSGCPLSKQPVPIHASWKVSATGAMSVIDYTTRKVYDFFKVTTNSDGTVKINADGTVSAAWGGVTDFDGNGQSPGASDSDLSLVFGEVRVYEMARAATDPANAIQHALSFSSQYICSGTLRYPATRNTSGAYTGGGCIPMGTRVFLDSAADCSIVSPTGEKAICYALKNYGAYATAYRAGTAFSLGFEAPTSGQPGGSGPDPYPGVGLGSNTGLTSIPWSHLKIAADCQCKTSNLTLTSGRAFAEKAASNLPLPVAPSLDTNSAAIVANLNSNNLHLAPYQYGQPTYDASAGAPRAVVCTESWGECPIQGMVAIHDSWKASWNRSLTVIDYESRKVYDFYKVATDPDGTVKINADGTVSTGWGGVTSLDGNGQSPGGNDSFISQLFGRIRVFEMARAVTDPENAIQHALGFGSRFICSNGSYFYPAMRSEGFYSGTGCIRAGSRVFLDSSTDCSIVSPAGERAICYALKKYGAYAAGYSGAEFEILYEAPTDGLPGGSVSNPYPAAGIVGDNYNLTNIPWSKLKVARNCLCTPY